MSTVHSADGTTICFDAWGDGQPLIMVDSATSHRAVSQLNAQVGQLLGEEFRVYAYDRRGRGESGDTAPYAVQREVEDLAALIAEAGAPAFVCGFSSGAVLALDAAAAGLLPTASLQAVEGEQHNVAAEVLAPVLRRFASGEPATADVQ